MGCAGEGSRTRRGGRPRPPGREELFTTPHTQQIPRTLLPRKRGCKQLGMTSHTILDSLIRSALSICNVALINMQRPTGVTAIAVVFLLIAAYLGGHRRCDARVAGSCVDDTRRTPAARIRPGRARTRLC